MVGGGVREFVYKVELVDLLWIGISGPVPIGTFQEQLTCFSNVKSIIFYTLQLVHTRLDDLQLTRVVMG
jgi:hypothetical protein